LRHAGATVLQQEAERRAPIYARNEDDAMNLCAIASHDQRRRPRAAGVLFLFMLASCLAWGFGAAWAGSGASDWFVTEQGRVRLVSGAAGGDGRVALGVEFRLAPHWKIYWRTPGDAGYAPRLDWSGSANLAAAVLRWPAPERFSVLGLETVGYAEGVVLPIAARLADGGAPLAVKLGLEYLTCNDICIPYETVLTLEVPAHGSATGYEALLERWAARVPGDGAASGLTLEGSAVVAGAHPALAVRVRSARPLGSPDVFVEGAGALSFARPSVSEEGAGTYVLRLAASGEVAGLVGQPLRLTVIDGERRLEGEAVPGMAPAADASGWLAMLGLALLGGFILNFMPCVLPVLSLKLLSAIGPAGREGREVRLGFLASALGVLVSFLVLALATLGLKAAGLAVGWGVQFQEPAFLVAMVVVVVLFAANLWGLFEVPLPGLVGDLGGVGGRGLLGHVATGAFATLLATPCSAPFLGTAVGFALAGGGLSILGIFLALGVGFASPYLLVAAVPRLALLLPRPGRWMVGLRRVLGVALLGAAVWLLWVLAVQAGGWAALVVSGLMAGMVAVLWRRPAVAARRAALAGLVAAAVLVPLVWPSPDGAARGDGIWRPFDEGAIAGLVGEGRVVFVDVTAAWCLTCRVNETLVLDQPQVHQALSAPAVVAMRADWTRPDAAIGAYLKRYGRYGIPFYAVYGPAAPQGIPLGEIVTPERVTAALKDAAKPQRQDAAAR
jgi:suppressor for copper-sensitivity B